MALVVRGQRWVTVESGPLMDWSCPVDGDLRVTQNAQGQLLSSGNGFNCRSQYR